MRMTSQGAGMQIVRPTGNNFGLIGPPRTRIVSRPKYEKRRFPYFAFEATV